MAAAATSTLKALEAQVRVATRRLPAALKWALTQGVLSPTEQQLLAHYRALDPRRRRAIRTFCAELAAFTAQEADRA